MINIESDLSFNTITLPAGSYTYEQALNVIGAVEVEEDGMKYISLPETFTSGNITDCYYFHNLKNGDSSCLSAIYEVCQNRKLILTNYTGTVDLTTIETIDPFKYLICEKWNVGSEIFIYNISIDQSTTVGQIDYYKLFKHWTRAYDVNIIDNTYYFHYENYAFALTNYGTAEWNPAAITIDDDIASELIYDNFKTYINYATFFPAYFNYGQPLRLMEQFKKTIEIDIPNGTYTFEQFKEILPTILPEGYTFADDTISVTEPINTFKFESDLFNMNNAEETMNFKMEDPLKGYRGVVYTSNNQHMFVIPTTSNPSYLMNLDNTPQFVEIPKTRYPCYFQLSTKSFKEANKELLLKSFATKLSDISISEQEGWSKVKLIGYLHNLDLINETVGTINDQTYTVHTQYQIDSTFTLPVTCLGDQLLFIGKAILVN